MTTCPHWALHWENYIEGWQQSLKNAKRHYHIYDTDCRWNNRSTSMLSFLNLLIMLLHKSKWHLSFSKNSWKKVMECSLFDSTGGELCVWRLSRRCVVRALLSLWLTDHSPWPQGCWDRTLWQWEYLSHGREKVTNYSPQKYTPSHWFPPARPNLFKSLLFLH